MKRFVAFLLVCVLVLALAGCGSSGGGTSGNGTGGESSGSSDAIATIDDLKAVLAEEYADTNWYPDITDYTMETCLGADVLAVHVAWGANADDWEANNAKQQGIQETFPNLNIEIARNVALIDATGAMWLLTATGYGDTAPMGEAFDLPAAPTTAEEFKAWLDAVYGPGGIVTLGPDETWYGSIQSVTFEDLYGNGSHLVIRTNIAADDTTQQSLLQSAIITTGSPLLAEVSIQHAGGAGSAFSAGGGEPGQGGWMYPISQ